MDEGSPSWLKHRIAEGRERKARTFARRIWNVWTEGERRGAGVAKLEKEEREYWKQLANSLGENEPSMSTIDLVLAKLREGTARFRLYGEKMR